MASGFIKSLSIIQQLFCPKYPTCLRQSALKLSSLSSTLSSQPVLKPINANRNDVSSLSLAQKSNICNNFEYFLQVPDLSSQFSQVRYYESVLRPRLHCKGCYFVWRHGRKYVECADVPSHKQMKKVITRKLWKEDYTKGNVRKAMDWNRDHLRIAQRVCDKKVLSHNWLASRIGKDV